MIRCLTLLICGMLIAFSLVRHLLGLYWRPPLLQLVTGQGRSRNFKRDWGRWGGGGEVQLLTGVI